METSWVPVTVTVTVRCELELVTWNPLCSHDDSSLASATCRELHIQHTDFNITKLHTPHVASYGLGAQYILSAIVSWCPSCYNFFVSRYPRALSCQWAWFARTRCSKIWGNTLGGPASASEFNAWLGTDSSSETYSSSVCIGTRLWMFLHFIFGSQLGLTMEIGPRLRTATNCWSSQNWVHSSLAMNQDSQALPHWQTLQFKLTTKSFWYWPDHMQHILLRPNLGVVGCISV
jgi:hypothetical protein